jgi:hypothetical protein
MKKLGRGLIALYILSYVLFRFLNAETWDQDGKTYVIFPNWDGSVTYYFYRPLVIIDSKLTAMNFHIGPHQ